MNEMPKYDPRVEIEFRVRSVVPEIDLNTMDFQKVKCFGSIHTLYAASITDMVDLETTPKIRKHFQMILRDVVFDSILRGFDEMTDDEFEQGLRIMKLVLGGGK